MDNMWKRLLLYTALAAIVLHTLCVYVAAEFTFVVNQMHQLESSVSITSTCSTGSLVDVDVHDEDREKQFSLMICVS